jgi:hypothetical protein
MRQSPQCIKIVRVGKVATVATLTNPSGDDPSPILTKYDYHPKIPEYHPIAPEQEKDGGQRADAAHELTGEGEDEPNDDDNGMWSTLKQF